MSTEQKPTLEDLATDMRRCNENLQEATDTYRNFVIALREIARALTREAGIVRLPKIAFRFPGFPSLAERVLDLGELTDVQLTAVKPLFSIMADKSGEELLRAWDAVLEVAGTAAPQVIDARRDGSASGD